MISSWIVNFNSHSAVHICLVCVYVNSRGYGKILWLAPPFFEPTQSMPPSHCTVVTRCWTRNQKKEREDADKKEKYCGYPIHATASHCTVFRSVTPGQEKRKKEAGMVLSQAPPSFELNQPTSSATVVSLDNTTKRSSTQKSKFKALSVLIGVTIFEEKEYCRGKHFPFITALFGQELI